MFVSFITYEQSIIRSSLNGSCVEKQVNKHIHNLCSLSDFSDLSKSRCCRFRARIFFFCYIFRPKKKNKKKKQKKEQKNKKQTLDWRKMYYFEKFSDNSTKDKIGGC